MSNLARRVSVMDESGVAFVFFAQREQAERMVGFGLATRRDAGEIRLTCHSQSGPIDGPRGQSLPQYRDGRTMMLAKHYERLGSFVRW